MYIVRIFIKKSLVVRFLDEKIVVGREISGKIVTVGYESTFEERTNHTTRKN